MNGADESSQFIRPLESIHFCFPSNGRLIAVSSNLKHTSIIPVNLTVQTNHCKQNSCTRRDVVSFLQSLSSSSTGGNAASFEGLARPVEWVRGNTYLEMRKP